MDGTSIGKIRRGQSEERDDRLGALLLERGFLSPETLREFRLAGPKGGLGEALLRSGRLTLEQLENLRREASVREIFESALEEGVPEEVRRLTAHHENRVGKYLLLYPIGRGGMGEVWKGWDESLRRPVAVKFLKTTDEEQLQRFSREAALAAQLSHPGITQVYEIATHSSRPYLVLQYVEGRSFDRVRLEIRRAAEVARDAARAVHYAHEQNIIHRDLKPANLLEGIGGKVYITDFGLARPIQSGANLTRTGYILGTPSYMAPEQIRGTATDPRTDVYGLGATLYTLVRGSAPFHGSSDFDVMQKILKEDPPRLRENREISAIVEKALQREPKDRYPSASSMAEDLDRYLRGEPIQARPVGVVTRMWRRLRRRPALAASLALLLVTGIGTTTYLLDRRQREKERRAEEALQKARRIQDEIRHLLRAPPADPKILDAALTDFDSAVQAALRHAPGYAPVRYYRALGLHYRRRHREAEEECTHALGADPKHHDARFLRGLSRFLQIGAPPIALVEEKGTYRVAYAPYGPREHTLLSRAEEDFAALPADNANRNYARALVAFARGDAAEAIQLLRQALESRFYIAQLREILIMALQLAGRHEEAEQEATRTIKKLNVRSAVVLASRAYARTILGRADGAIEDAREALAISPGLNTLRKTLTRLLLDRSVSHLKAKRIADAIADADEARRLSPRSFRAQRRLGKNQWAAALALEKEGRSVEAWKHLAEAEGALTRALGIRSDDTDTLVLRGLVRIQLRRYAGAAKDFQKAISIKPDLEPSLRDPLRECEKRASD